MDIKKGSIQDLENVMEIIKSCIEDMEARGINQWIAGFYPAEDNIKSDIDSGSLYVLKDKSDYLGTITINENQPPEYQELEWLIKKRSILVIHRFAVDPQYQHSGNGSRLMNFAESFAQKKNYDAIRLDAYSGNPAVLSFYEDRGYKKRGEVYFPRRELPFYCYEKLV